MKRVLIVLGLAAVAGLAAWWPVSGMSAEEAGVRAALNHYLQGQATGQAEEYRKVFHADAKLVAVREGKYWQLSSEEFINRASGKPAADEAQRKRSIESIDIAGNAAMAKIVLDYPTVRFTDYMSLLKIDGQWKIVNKTFHAEQRTK